MSLPVRVLFLDKTQSVIYESHIHFIDESSTEFFPSIHNLLIAKTVCFSISNLIAKSIIKNSELYFLQSMNISLMIPVANFMTESPTLKIKMKKEESVLCTALS